MPAMLRPLVAYLITGVVFVVLDGGWLTLAGPRLYKPELGPLLSDKVNLGAATAFYLLYIGGLVYFCVMPALAQSSWMKALVAGAILGLVAYGAYDLTNLATLKQWSLKVTIADLCWGAFASAVAATIATLATRKLG